MRPSSATHVLMVVAAAILAAAPVTAQSGKCEADHQCFDDEFCYTKTGFCAKCVSCSKYQRYNSPRVHCPKSAQDCGGCYKGYEEEYLSDANRRDLCKLTIKNITTPQPDVPTDPINYLNYLVPIVGTIFGVIVAGMVAYCCYLHRQLILVWTKGLQRDPPDIEAVRDLKPPPEYSEYSRSERDRLMAIASAPPDTGTREPSPTRSVYLNISEPEGESLQKAKPFIYPQVPYRGSDSEDQSLEQDIDDSPNGHYSPTPPVEDEETIPSDWVPTSNLGNQLNDSGTSDLESGQQSAVGTPARGSQLDIASNNVTVPQLNFSGIFAQTRPGSPEMVHTPAKRQRLDSGAHSVASDGTESDNSSCAGSQPANQPAVAFTNQPVNVVVNNNINVYQSNG